MFDIFVVTRFVVLCLCVFVFGAIVYCGGIRKQETGVKNMMDQCFWWATNKFYFGISLLSVVRLFH